MIKFDRNLVYPSDSFGGLREIEGPVVKVGKSLGDAIMVEISSSYGNISGYAHGPMVDTAPIATTARIRVHDCGGGYYPDNEVVSLSTSVEKATVYGIMES
jgi:hypothetical protein